MQTHGANALPEIAPQRAGLKKVRRVVVKVGTSLLTGTTVGQASSLSGGRQDACPTVDRRYVGRLVRAVGELWTQGRQTAIVTSGAIGAGCGLLNFAARPESLPERQACAAAGQVALMGLYAQAFRRAKPPRAVGQLLLTRDGLEARERYLNARHTLEALFARGAVPIVNENDTVSVDEIRFGDNDLLSALVAAVAEAELLVILTDVPGLMDAPPKQDPGARLIDIVEEITPELEAAAGPSRSRLGTGGMVSKLEAAKIARASGINLVLADGRNPEVLAQIVEGRSVGTFFPPKGDRLAARKRWLAFTARPRGVLHLDAGAREALVHRHKSLLPSGIVRIEGQFESGDLLDLAGPDGRPFARGLTNYGSAELERIRGKRTPQIASELGVLLFDEVVHCDNLVVL